MAQKETIRDFLVSLGYEVDKQSETKFKESMRGAVVQANLMSAALIETAKSVFEAVAKISQSFDALYWTSQRTGDSVENIRALSYAVSQLGGTYDGARSAIQAFGQHLRSNPGYAGMLRSLGVNTSENGKMRDQVLILEDLGKALARKPYYQALQYANALGLDENTMRALMSGDLARQMAHYKDIQKSVGLDSDKAAKSSKELMNSLRDVEAHVEAVATKILTDLQPQITQVLTAISKWFVDHKDDIKGFIVGFAEAVKGLAEDLNTLVTELKPVWEGFDHIAKSLTGKDGLQAAFEAFAIYITGAWILGILGAFGKLRGGWIALLGALVWNATPSTPDDVNKRLNDGPNQSFEGTGIGGAIRRFRNRARGYLGLDGKTSSGGPEVGPKTSKNAIKMAGEAYQFWRSKGLSHGQALGMIANEEGESGFNIHTPGDWDPKLNRYTAGGAFQWHKDRRDAILKGTGIDVWSKNTTHKQMLEGSWWELNHTESGALKALRGTDDPYEAAARITRLYERPRNVAGDSAQRGRRAQVWGRHFHPGDFKAPPPLPNGGAANSNSATGANLNQTTNITVNGSTDPHATANAIERKQSGVNSTLLRNTQGAAR